MAYSNFTFDKIRKELNLMTEDKTGLFSHITEVKADEYFSKSLKEDNIHLGLAINTEKARSELIIAPVLLELRKMTDKQVSLFSLNNQVFWSGQPTGLRISFLLNSSTSRRLDCQILKTRNN